MGIDCASHRIYYNLLYNNFNSPHQQLKWLVFRRCRFYDSVFRRICGTKIEYRKEETTVQVKRLPERKREKENERERTRERVFVWCVCV